MSSEERPSKRSEQTGHSDDPVDYIYLHFDEIRARAGLHDVRIHDLRHTYASNAVSSGMPIQMVGRLLGHTQIQTTMRYAHLANDPVRRAAEENADRLSGFVSGNADSAPKLKLVGQPD